VIFVVERRFVVGYFVQNDIVPVGQGCISTSWLVMLYIYVPVNVCLTGVHEFQVCAPKTCKIFDKRHGGLPTFRVVCKVQENQPVAIESHQIIILWVPEDIKYAVFIITQVQNSVESVDYVCKVRYFAWNFVTCSDYDCYLMLMPKNEGTTYFVAKRV
jgi:hypothetical protein